VFRAILPPHQSVDDTKVFNGQSYPQQVVLMNPDKQNLTSADSLKQAV